VKTNPKPDLAIVALALLILLAPPTPARGQDIPALINYQGALTDNLGVPLTNGYYQVEFRVWDHPTQAGAGNFIWGRSFPLYVAPGGLFNVLLSDDGGELTKPGTPKTASLLDAFAGPDRYLGLTVTANPQGSIPTAVEISPRQQLVSAPYAVHAHDAASLGGTKAKDYAQIGSGLRGGVVPAFVAGALTDSALSATGTDKIGINSTSPSQALDVVGNAVVSGSLGASTLSFSLDGSAYLTVKDTGSGQRNPAINFDGYDWLEYSRPQNKWIFYIDSGAKLSVSSDGLATTGPITSGGSVLAAAGDSGGFHFPLSAYDGTGDYANLKLNRAGTSGDNQILSLNVGNDPGELLQLNSTGNIELRANSTNGIVSVHGKVSAFGSLYVRTAGTPYTADTDGFVTFHGYHGHAHFTLTAVEGGTLFDDNYFFTEGGADTMLATWPVAKGEQYKWDFESFDRRGYCVIRWRPLGQ